MKFNYIKTNKIYWWR